jgi:hypothetical protein
MTVPANDELLVSYRRGGGRSPPDDERLDIRGDGSFDARRTVGVARAGGFAGVLDERLREQLASAVEAVAGADDVAIPTPRDGASEIVMAAGREAVLGAGMRPPGPWAGLLDQLRSLIVGVVVPSPRAAIELEATAGSAALVHAGSEPLEVDLSLAEVHVVRIDGQGIPGERWFATSQRPIDLEEPPPPRWVTATPGWRLDLPFAHGIELVPGDSLQVIATVPILEGGTRRVAKLGVYVRG